MSWFSPSTWKTLKTIGITASATLVVAFVGYKCWNWPVTVPAEKPQQHTEMKAPDSGASRLFEIFLKDASDKASEKVTQNLQPKLDEINGKLGDQGKQLADTSKNVGELKSEVADLKKDQVDLKKENADLKKVNTDLTQRVEAVENKPAPKPDVDGMISEITKRLQATAPAPKAEEKPLAPSESEPMVGQKGFPSGEPNDGRRPGRTPTAVEKPNYSSNEQCPIAGDKFIPRLGRCVATLANSK